MLFTLKKVFLLILMQGTFFHRKVACHQMLKQKIFCEAGLDKDGFDVKYLSDYKGIYMYIF